MIALLLASAFITRLMFIFHVFISVGLFVVHTQQAVYWYFMSGVVFIIIEMVFIMVKRKGKEYKLFWPSCFFYLSAMLPVIWIMELDLLHHRLEQRDQLESKLEDPSSPPIKIKGLDIKAVLDNDVAAKTVGQLGVVVVIIIGRWLLPRGQLTRDQLSALLLGYIATGADILDMSGSISNEKIAYNINMHYVILTVFSWSMLQFCITATVSAGSGTVGSTTVDLESGRDVHDSGKESSSSSQHRNSILSSRSNTKPKPNCFCKCNADLLQIFVPLLMQDGPFLILRIFMWAKYEVSDEIHLYFTGKNALTVTLLLYRLYCLNVKDRSQGGGTGVDEIGMENQAVKETDNEDQGEKHKENENESSESATEDEEDSAGKQHKEK